MTTPDIKQHKKIIAKAPEKARITFTVCEDMQRVYVDDLDALVNGTSDWWADYDGKIKVFDPEERYTVINNDFKSLDDLRTIVEQAEQLEAIKQSRDIYKDMLKTVLSITNQNPASIELQTKLKEFEKALKK